MKILVGFVVLAYLALHTVNFFKYTFPPEQFYYAYLGFGLTGLGAIAYLCVFLWDADTPIKRTIALVMVIICGLGEVLAASFGMQIEAWAKNGWVMTENDFRSMMFAIQILAFIHLIALVLYVASDKIAEMFGDADGDGIPNYRDPDYKKSTQIQYAADVPAAENKNGKHATDPTSQPRR